MAAAVSRWRTYLRLGRVSNLPTVWTNGWAGAMLAGFAPTLELAFGLALALSCFYVSGMFLNDAFDWKFDTQFRPERPIPQGLITRAEVQAAGLVLLGLGMGLVAVLGSSHAGCAGRPVAAGAVLAGLIVYYNFSHKQSRFSPLVMALCRAMTYVVAAAIVAEVLTASVWVGAGVLTAYVIGLSYVAKQENLKSIENLWPLVLLAGPLVYGAVAALREPLSLVWAVLLLAWALYAVSFLVRANGKSIPRAVVSLIAGISLVDAVIIQSTRAHAAWAIACLACFGLTLCLQRFISGT